MLAFASFELIDGRIATLTPGDIVGRTWSAALRIDDPHVSEAHAMLSLRGEELVLLSLRRRLYVDGKAADTVALRPGLRVRLAPEVELRVVELSVPGEVLSLSGPGLPPTVLSGTCSLVFAPQPRLVPGLSPEARAVFWATDERWRVRVGGGSAQELVAGATLRVEGQDFRAGAVALERAAQAATRIDHAAPLRVVAHFDTVHIHRGGGAPLVLSGQLARLISELVSVGAPLAWTELAAAQWPQIEDRDQLRRRWDVLLARLRERLRDGGVRPDLVQSTRVGLVELVLQDGDSVEDRT